MSIFALIGGKSNPFIGHNKLEKHLVSLAAKENPKILFCPYASTNIEKSIKNFHLLMQGVPAIIMDLTFENINQFEALIDACDIFYIAGGHCDDLVQLFKENKLDKILGKYINQNKIFAGSSAGAMLYTMAAMGDKYVFYDNYHYYNYKMVECLGYLNVTICPHYQVEDLTMYNDEVKNYPMDGFGIEEDTMVVLKENHFYVVKEFQNKSVYYFEKNKGYKMIPLYEGVLYEKDCGFRS